MITEQGRHHRWSSCHCPVIWPRAIRTNWKAFSCFKHPRKSTQSFSFILSGHISRENHTHRGSHSLNGSSSHKTMVLSFVPLKQNTRDIQIRKKKVLFKRLVSTIPVHSQLMPLHLVLCWSRISQCSVWQSKMFTYGSQEAKTEKERNNGPNIRLRNMLPMAWLSPTSPYLHRFNQYPNSSILVHL